jgi:tetratricopeptide (TPR) repeat protein
MKLLSKHVSLIVFLAVIAVILGSCSRDPQRAKAKYLAAGKNYMRRGQYGDAAIEFRNALRLDPRFIDAYYQLAQAEMAEQDWGPAYASLEKAIDLDPGRLDARLDRGRLYLAARQFDKAQDEANFILEQNSKDVAAYQLLGAALIGEQKADQALAAFLKINQLRPQDPSSYVNTALVEISLHRFSDAEVQLKKAVIVDPKSTQASMDLANFYELQNRIPEAQQVLKDGISKNSAGIALYIDWASILASQGKEQNAEVVLDQLRKQMPDSADAAMEIGDFYLKQERPNQALAEYQRGLGSSPHNLSIDKRIEDLYLSTGQVQPASELDRELMKDAPNDVTVQIDHARLLMSQDRLQDSILDLQKIVADAADSSQANYFLAMAYWQHGDIGQAHSSLIEALRISPGLPRILQALTRLSLAQGNTSDAVDYARELVQKFPADHVNRQLLAEALAQHGQLPQAEEQYLVAKQLAPNDGAIRLGLAQILSAEKKWPQAQSEFQSAFELDPHSTTALAQWSDFLTAQGQSSQALARVQQYVSTNPNDAQGHVILGGLYFKSKSYAPAQREFERSIELDPKEIQAYLRLGKLYEVQGQVDLAIARYQKALELRPNLAPLATMVGNLYLNKGDLEVARRFYRQALDADPNFAVASANTAWIDAAEGQNLNVALSLAQRAQSQMPEVPSISDTLAWVMYKRGDYAGAKALLEECVQKVPDSPEFHYHLGMALMATGEKMRGREHLEDALRMKLDRGDSQKAQQVLSQLQ